MTFYILQSKEGKRNFLFGLFCIISVSEKGPFIFSFDMLRIVYPYMQRLTQPFIEYAALECMDVGILSR